MALTDSRPTAPQRDPYSDPDGGGSKFPWLLAIVAIAALVIAGFFLLGGDADVDVDGGDIDVDAPSLDADVDAPDIDVETPETDIELPSVDVDPGSIDSEGSFDVDVNEADAEADAG